MINRARSCYGCENWCPMHGERRQFAPLGVCAISGNPVEREALCSHYSAAPVATPTEALISAPCWKDAPAQPQLALGI